MFAVLPDHRERLAPVPLTRKQPVAQFVIDAPLAAAVGFEPVDDFDFRVGSGQSVQVENRVARTDYDPIPAKAFIPEVITDVEVTPSQGDGQALSREVLLGIAGEIESASSHPLASAIRRYCEENNASAQVGTGFEEVAGRGVKANFDSLHQTAITVMVLEMVSDASDDCTRYIS